MPTFRLYNTLTRSVDEVIPIDPPYLRLYACGPTVYSYAHIGNFRSFLTADLIARTAEASGLEPRFVMNITDVGHLTEDDVADASGEDRMEKALRSKEGERFANIWDLARYYTESMQRDWTLLNLRQPLVQPRATEHVREQIDAVQKLVEKGHAYETSSGVYFDVSSFPGYGKLSGNVESASLDTAVRDVVVDEEKRDPRDFALWKKDEKHLMQWHSPWGWGFPGWHIECSVMSSKYLGDQLDIHAGGEDLIFPHHECEIAQAESLTGEVFARHWVHTRFLQVEGAKMSKRDGNFYTVRDLIADPSEGGKGVDPLAVRLSLISGYYRKPFNFTLETLRANIKHIDRIRRAYELVANVNSDDEDEQLENALSALYDKALAAMQDDLNTPEAIAALLEGIKEINSRESELASVASVKDWLDRMNKLLGVLSHDNDVDAPDSEGEGSFAEMIESMIEERQRARAERDFARADQLRDEIEAHGVELMDTPAGPKWKKTAAI